jgi:hypothetical protein
MFFSRKITPFIELFYSCTTCGGDKAEKGEFQKRGKKSPNLIFGLGKDLLDQLRAVFDVEITAGANGLLQLIGHDQKLVQGHAVKLNVGLHHVFKILALDVFLRLVAEPTTFLFAFPAFIKKFPEPVR